MSLEAFLPFLLFWNSLRRIGISSSINVWVNSPVKPSGPGLLFGGKFLVTASIFLLVIDLFRFSIFSYFSFGSLYVSRNASIFIRDIG